MLPLFTKIFYCWNNSDKSSDFRIVISCFEEIQVGFCIVVVGSISERIKRAKITIGSIQFNLTVTPRIVLIFYHNRTIAVK